MGHVGVFKLIPVLLWLCTIHRSLQWLKFGLQEEEEGDLETYPAESASLKAVQTQCQTHNKPNKGGREGPSLSHSEWLHDD